ncbi:MAG: GxxExxY protein [Phycisphaerae bacterium]
MAETDLLHSELTREIIGAAMEVHKTFGCGFLESVYEEALAIEFNLRKISYERQKGINIEYKGFLAKQFICDFLVGQKVLVELKAIKAITGVEEAQLLNYLKATGIEIGLLINFGEQSLRYKRLVLQKQKATVDKMELNETAD